MPDPSLTKVAVSYDGKQIIPAPFVGLTRQTVRSADGTVRRKFWSLKLSGWILPLMGSPGDTGGFHTSAGYPADTSGTRSGPTYLFDDIQNKKQALAGLFAVDGKAFSIAPPAGTTRTCYPRWGEVSFEPGQEINNVRWSVSGEVDWISGLDDAADASSSPPEESWECERADEVGRTYRVTHTVSSQQVARLSAGAPVPGWQVAKDFVLGTGLAGSGAVAKLGFATAPLSGSAITGVGGYDVHNYVRKETVDEAQGRYAVVETWLLFDGSTPSGLTGGNAIEELTVETRFALESGLTTVTLNGQIIGLEDRNNDTYELATSRVDNAEARLASLNYSVAHELAEASSGTTLNPIPTGTSTSKNRVSGVYGWSCVFDTRPANSSTSFLTETVTVELDLAAAVIAQIPVPLRGAGPVLQNTGTVTQAAVTVTMEISVPVRYGSPAVRPATNPLPFALDAIGFTPTTIYCVADKPRWTAKTGRFSRTTTYIYQP